MTACDAEDRPAAAAGAIPGSEEHGPALWRRRKAGEKERDGRRPSGAEEEAEEAEPAGSGSGSGGCDEGPGDAPGDAGAAARAAALAAEVAALEATLALLKRELAGGKSGAASAAAAGTTFDRRAERIKRLHEYNAVKDVAQMLIGKLAEAEGTTTREIYRRLELASDD